MTRTLTTADLDALIKAYREAGDRKQASALARLRMSIRNKGDRMVGTDYWTVSRAAVAIGY